MLHQVARSCGNQQQFGGFSSFRTSEHGAAEIALLAGSVLRRQMFRRCDTDGADRDVRCAVGKRRGNALWF